MIRVDEVWSVIYRNLAVTAWTVAGLMLATFLYAKDCGAL